MDKELLRLAIIIVGLVVMAGMVLWHYWQHRHQDDDSAFPPSRDEHDDAEDLRISTEDDEDFDLVPLGSALADDWDELTAPPSRPTTPGKKSPPATPTVAPTSTPARPVPDTTTSGMPEIIQFSIVSREQAGFNGAQLAVAFRMVGLQYGERKIFQQLNHTGQVEFSVASIVEPGTFPESDLDSFYCPGIVLFMQPKRIDNPLQAYDDMVEVVERLTQQLDGIAWDDKRKQLTAETVELIRERLY